MGNNSVKYELWEIIQCDSLSFYMYQTYKKISMQHVSILCATCLMEVPIRK